MLFWGQGLVLWSKFSIPRIYFFCQASLSLTNIVMLIGHTMVVINSVSQPRFSQARSHKSGVKRTWEQIKNKKWVKTHRLTFISYMYNISKALVLQSVSDVGYCFIEAQWNYFDITYALTKIPKKWRWQDKMCCTSCAAQVTTEAYPCKKWATIVTLKTQVQTWSHLTNQYSCLVYRPLFRFLSPITVCGLRWTERSSSGLDGVHFDLSWIHN